MKLISKYIETLIGKTVVLGAVALASISAQAQEPVLLSKAKIQDLKKNPEVYVSARDLDMFTELFDVKVAPTVEAKIELIRSIKVEHLEFFKEAVASEAIKPSPSCHC